MRIAILLLGACTSACLLVVDDETTADLSKKDARAQALEERDHGARFDYCELHGWYEDGACDDFCLTPDSDCDLQGAPPCAGPMAWPCEDEGNDFCDFTSGCGDSDVLGHCAVIPGICTQEYAPVCGCDGETYGNACTANGGAVAIAHDGPCRSPL